jgi:hypothetical protein
MQRWQNNIWKGQTNQLGELKISPDCKKDVRSDRSDVTIGSALVELLNKDIILRNEIVRFGKY